jgi:hypothetical protein
MWHTHAISANGAHVWGLDRTRPSALTSAAVEEHLAVANLKLVSTEGLGALELVEFVGGDSGES